MTHVAEKYDTYASDFERLNAQNPVPDWLSVLRTGALARFRQLGWPTTKVEAWRFTNVNTIAQTPFVLNHEHEPVNDSEDANPWADLAAEFLPNAIRLVFIDGCFSSERSDLDGLPGGATICALARAIEGDEPQLASRIGSLVHDGEAFAALNTAFLADGAFIRLADGVHLERPVQLVFAGGGATRPTLAHPRNLILAGRNSKLTLVETHVSAPGAPFFINQVTELFAQAGATVIHYQSEICQENSFHIATLEARLESGSRFESHNLLLGGALVRQNLRVELAGRSAECDLNGLLVGHGQQLQDFDVLVKHAHRECRSRQYFKCILDDRARGVFSGRVVVARDAQKADAGQTNRNLLLSEDAKIDTKPQLEIYADDVKCSHGATTGHLDADGLFYLQSRGIDPRSARDILIYAFAHEIVERMGLEPLRQRVESLLMERFAKEQPLGEQL